MWDTRTAMLTRVLHLSAGGSPGLVNGYEITGVDGAGIRSPLVFINEQTTLKLGPGCEREVENRSRACQQAFPLVPSSTLYHKLAEIWCWCRCSTTSSLCCTRPLHAVS